MLPAAPPGGWWKSWPEARGLSYDTDARHGRHGLVGERGRAEIGLHAVRGGDVVGEHTVLFADLGERVELVHRASSRETLCRRGVARGDVAPGAASGFVRHGGRARLARRYVAASRRRASITSSCRMKCSRGFFLLVAALAVAAARLAAQGPNQPATAAEPALQSGGEVAAAAAVDVWLGLVDDHRLPESWQTAASIFKKAVTQEQWISLMNSRRQPIGKLLSRKNTSKIFTRVVPGAPDGQYVVLQFDTSFENKKTAVETITAMLDVDGQWRVAGYSVH